MPNTRIAVVGAGAMGSLFGGRLAEADMLVSLVDLNPAHIAAISAQGLRLQTDSGDRRITNVSALTPAQACERIQALPKQPELLILFTKTLHTRAALEGVRPLIGPDTVVLSLQNGLGNVEKIQAFVDPKRILIGVTNWPADLLGPGHVRSHGSGSVRLMSADGVIRPGVASCVRWLNAAGLRCEADLAVWSAIWQKVAFNAALNSLCAVTGCTVDQVALRPDAQALAQAVAREVLAVARAKKVAIDELKTLSDIAHAIASHRGHKPSMLQDIEAGRLTEIESINGAVVAAARETATPVPNTQALLTLVRLLEARRAAAPAPAG